MGAGGVPERARPPDRGEPVPGSTIDFSRYVAVSYDAFRQRALDPSLSEHEKVGFPDVYREGQEKAIFDDITSKLTRLNLRGLLVVDIGPGCGPLARLMMEHCERQGHRRRSTHRKCWPSCRRLQTPRESEGASRASVKGLAERRGQADCVLAYGVLSCVFEDGNVFDFVDRSLELLTPGGQLLLADVPNLSKRKRFFASDAGRRFHENFMGGSAPLDVQFNVLDPGTLDDGVILGLLARCRGAGFDAYIVPQASGLPFANRREDILVTRP